jgi:chromosome segregation ATPase
MKSVEEAIKSEWLIYASSVEEQLKTLFSKTQMLDGTNAQLSADVTACSDEIKRLTEENVRLRESITEEELKNEEISQKNRKLLKSLSDTLGQYGYENESFDDEMQVDSLGYILDDLTADLNVARDENASLKKNNSDLKSEIKRHKKDIQVITKEKEACERTIQQLNEKMAVLESQHESDASTISKLSEQNTFLLGHQNPNQKIHHIKQLKDEVNSFKKRCREQDELIRKYKRHCGRSFELDDEEVDQIHSSGNDENFNPALKTPNPKAPKTPRTAGQSSRRYNLRHHN